MADRKNPVFLKIVIVVIALFLGLSLNMFQFRNPFRTLPSETSPPPAPVAQAPKAPVPQVYQEPAPKAAQEPVARPVAEPQAQQKKEEPAPKAEAPAQAPPAPKEAAAKADPAPAAPEAQPKEAGEPAPAAVEVAALPSSPALSQPRVTDDKDKARAAKLGRTSPVASAPADAGKAEKPAAPPKAPDPAPKDENSVANAPEAGAPQAAAAPEANPSGGKPGEVSAPSSVPSPQEAPAAPGPGPVESAEKLVEDAKPKAQEAAPAEKGVPGPVQGQLAKEAAKQPASEAKGGKVLEIKAEERAGEFVLTIVTDGPVERVTSFHAKGPSRLAVDIWGGWQVSGPSAKAVQGEFIEKVRVGAHPDKLRLVVDYRDKELSGAPEPSVEKQPKAVVVRLPRPAPAN